MKTVQFKLVHPDAQMPTRATDGAAGYDLYACEHRVILPGEAASVRTGVCVAMPSCIEFSVPAPPWMNERDARVYGRSRASFGIEAQVRGRSGLAFKHGVLGHVGTIDSDYRGEIGVLLLNTGRQPYEVKVGDRVAQLVFAPVLLPDLVEVDELPETQRGAGGFGSTGI